MSCIMMLSAHSKRIRGSSMEAYSSDLYNFELTEGDDELDVCWNCGRVIRFDELRDGCCPYCEAYIDDYDEAGGDK